MSVSVNEISVTLLPVLYMKNNTGRHFTRKRDTNDLYPFILRSSIENEIRKLTAVCEAKENITVIFIEKTTKEKTAFMQIYIVNNKVNL